MTRALARLLALAVLAMASGPGPAAEPLQLESRFSADEIRFVERPGKSQVSGSAKLKLADGTTRNCAGFNIELLPVSAYSSERILRTYGNTRAGQILLEQNPPKFTPDVTEYHEMLLKSVCDAQGRFRFENVPAGQYFVMAFIIRDGKGGAVMKRIRVGMADVVAYELGEDGPDPHDQSEASVKAAYPSLAYLTDAYATLAYQPAGAKVIQQPRALLPRSHPLHTTEEPYADDVVLLETMLAGAGKVWVVFSLGPSMDPGFYFLRPIDVAGDPWAQVDGTALALPGDGSVFTATRYDSHFTKRRKYLVSPAGLQEVPQPYYAVDLDTVALRPLKIFATPAEDRLVAELAAGAPLRVLLTDEKADALGRICYLVRDSGGLTGWVWVKSTQYRGEDIDGISWWGD